MFTDVSRVLSPCETNLLGKFQFVRMKKKNVFTKKVSCSVPLKWQVQFCFCSFSFPFIAFFFVAIMVFIESDWVKMGKGTEGETCLGRLLRQVSYPTPQLYSCFNTSNWLDIKPQYNHLMSWVYFLAAISFSLLNTGVNLCHSQIYLTFRTCVKVNATKPPAVSTFTLVSGSHMLGYWKALFYRQVLFCICKQMFYCLCIFE